MYLYRIILRFWTGEVYCFPRRQLIFRFGRRVIYHLKGLCEYIPKSIPSVYLHHNLLTNSGTLLLCLMLYNQWIRLNELYKQMESFFQVSDFFFKILTENRKIFKRIAGHEYWSNCNVLNVSMDLSQGVLQLKKSFFFQISFRNFWTITENFEQRAKILNRNSKMCIQKNSEAWTLIKLQCVVYQWICLNELYKLMKSFFEISN